MEERISELLLIQEASQTKLLELEKLLSSKEVELNVNQNRQASIESERVTSIKKLNQRVQTLDEELLRER